MWVYPTCDPVLMDEWMVEGADKWLEEGVSRDIYINM
jgi:hypothetical protein